MHSLVAVYQRKNERRSNDNLDVRIDYCLNPRWISSKTITQLLACCSARLETVAQTESRGRFAVPAEEGTPAMAGSKDTIQGRFLPGGPTHPGLLDGDEPPPFEIVSADREASAILVCDHASNRIPRCLGTLGLGQDALLSHIAWDPGAAEVARQMSELLNATLVLSAYSRLVIDCNRPTDSPESIPERSGGVPIPGNRSVSPNDRARRRQALFDPYHDAIGKVIDARAGRPNLLLSIHSFTAELDGQRRPWSVGLSYGRDARLALALRDVLARSGEFLVGENQPYSIDDLTDYTIPVHGEARGHPHVLIEIRQDLLTTRADTTQWARRLADAYGLIAQAALRLGHEP
jgi:predicted N-formylglutamate amidohydrolase